MNFFSLRRCFRRDVQFVLLTIIPRLNMEAVNLTNNDSSLSLTSIAGSVAVQTVDSELTPMEESESISQTSASPDTPVTPSSYLGNTALFIPNKEFFEYVQDRGFANVDPKTERPYKRKTHLDKVTPQMRQ